jgi:hypothetical protein
MRCKPTYPWYHIEKCPICGIETFEYFSVSEWLGTVEQHGNCSRCGYTVEQAYSPVFEAFWDVKRGYKHPTLGYIEKNVKRHKRIRKKKHIKDIEVNPLWIKYV